MAASNYLKQEILKQYFTSNITISLYISNPTASDTGIEVSGGGYKRMPISFTAPGTSITNKDTITFPLALTKWGRITHYAIRNSAGTLLVFGEIATPREVIASDEVVFRAGTVKIEFEV